MSITLNGTTGITTPALDSDGLTVARAGGAAGSGNVAYIDVTSSYGGLSINSSAGNNAFIEFLENGVKTAGFNSDATANVTSLQSANGHALALNTDGTTERMRIHASGGLSFANTTDVGPYNTVLGYRNNHFTGQRSNTVGAGATSTVLTLAFTALNGAAIVRVVDAGTVVTYNYFANVYEYFVTCRDGTVTATLKQSQIGGGAGSKITTSTSASTFNVIQTSDAGLATVHDTAIDVLVVAANNGSHATATITMAASN